MKLIETGSFPITDIEIGKRLRAVDPTWVKGLAAVFEQTGLQNPVQIMRVGNSLRLVAGAHRIEAFKLLGRTEIPAMVYEPQTATPEAEIRLQEIVENVARRELSALDRATHIAELKEQLRKLNGETRGRPSAEKSANIAPFSLGEEVAARMGLSKRTVFADAELHENLSPKVRQQLRDPEWAWLAENRAQLLALSKEDADDQLAILALLKGGDADGVSAASALHHNKVDTTAPDEKHVAAFIKLWTKSSKRARRQIADYVKQQQKGA